MPVGYFLDRFRTLHTEPAPASDPLNLTRRERQCLHWAANGLHDQEVADRLHIAPRTVLFHLANARSKLGAENRAQMIARGIAWGLIAP